MALRETRWHRRPAGRIDRLLRDWLTEPGSLTARCRRHCTRFAVRRLDQSRQAVGGGVLPVRDVLLECDGQPVIFARSSLSTARAGRLGAWFGQLGNRSLGSLLFAHPGFRRQGIEYCRLGPRDALHRRVSGLLGEQPDALWVRRSRHRLGAYSVLVIEVFLPAIMQLR
ncbi:chorismate lyase [Azonexus sp. R2A61]|uniref:chorismate--pyruvate lyase family protein n=1 Tax=Azonexus sp. R2A61 TaxID=2744443 RepID=UPI001F02FC60|nr:chorismate lyase [Azonexus sp. R2A61]